MDSEKLLRILNDVQLDEKKLVIDQAIDAIRADLSQNTPESYQTADIKLKEIIEEITEISISFRFSPSEQLLLEHIKGDAYFGKGLITHLKLIFDGKSFEFLSKIDAYRTRRTDFIQKTQRFITSASDLNIQEYRPNEYEVGLILPEEENDSKVITKQIRDLEILLSAIYEGVFGENKNIKITRVSNGSLEFFSLQPLQVAELLSTLLLNITLIWDKIVKLRGKAEEIDNDEALSAETKKTIKKAYEKETEKVKQEILEELPKKLLRELTHTKENDIKSKIHIGIKAIFAWFELGIEVDITPIRIENLNVAEDEETISKVGAIQETNSKLQEIYKLPKEQKKLPFSLSETQETSTSNKES